MSETVIEQEDVKEIKEVEVEKRKRGRPRKEVKDIVEKQKTERKPREKKYKTVEELQAHLKEYYTNYYRNKTKQDFECSYCASKFCNKSNYTRHLTLSKKCQLVRAKYAHLVQED